MPVEPELIDIKDTWTPQKKREAMDYNSAVLDAFGEASRTEKREQYGRSVADKWVKNGKISHSPKKKAPPPSQGRGRSR